MNKDGKSEDEVSAVVMMTHTHTHIFTSFQNTTKRQHYFRWKLPRRRKKFCFQHNPNISPACYCEFHKKKNKGAAKRGHLGFFLFKIRWAPTFYFEKFDNKYESFCSFRQRRGWSLKTIHSWQLQTTTAATTLTLPLSHNHDHHHRTDDHFSLCYQ